MDGKHLFLHRRWKNMKFIDRDWIDQRLYEQEDEVFQVSASSEARSLSFAFDQSLWSVDNG